MRFFCNSGRKRTSGAAPLPSEGKGNGTLRGHYIYAVLPWTDVGYLTATGQDKVKEGFLPLPAGFKSVPRMTFRHWKRQLTTTPRDHDRDGAGGGRRASGRAGVPASRHRAMQEAWTALIVDEVQRVWAGPASCLRTSITALSRISLPWPKGSAPGSRSARCWVKLARSLHGRKPCDNVWRHADCECRHPGHHRDDAGGQRAAREAGEYLMTKLMMRASVVILCEGDPW